MLSSAKESSYIPYRILQKWKKFDNFAHNLENFQ